MSLTTVDSWVRRGAPHQRTRGGGYAFKISEVAKWRAAQLAQDSQRRGNMNGGRRPIPDAAREWISLPHARAWLLMFSGFIESIGGDGMAKRIACEAHRLRGYPVPDAVASELDPEARL